MWYIRPGGSGADAAAVRTAPSRTPTRRGRPSASPEIDGRDGGGGAPPVSPRAPPDGGGDDSVASISGS